VYPVSAQHPAFSFWQQLLSVWLLAPDRIPIRVKPPVSVLPPLVWHAQPESLLVLLRVRLVSEP
jgi:hypothetical protein